VRIPSTFWGREEESTNLELKPADHSGNPYLAFGAMLAAGLDGLRRELQPGEPQGVDPGNLTDADRERLGITPLPRTLCAALDALENDAVLTEALGPLLSSAYVAVKRAEIEHFRDLSPEEEARQHVFKY
jgi:glutamine synthetase